MPYTGGDITEITCNHPTLGNKSFYPKAGEDGTYDLGGVRNDDDAQGLAGDGQMILKKTKGRWYFEVPIANDMVIQKEQEFLNSLAESALEADWTFTHINGTVYGGKGTIVGDIQLNANSSVLTFKIAGGLKLSAV